MQINPFASRLDNNFIGYVAFEIDQDFSKAVDNYNRNRFQVALDKNISQALNLDQKKVIDLPEIQKDGFTYFIQQSNSRIEFDIGLILNHKLKLNGIETTLEKQLNHDLVGATPFNIFNLLMDTSNASDAFVADPQSTRVLIAALLTLESGYESLGLLKLCLLQCKEDVAQINRERLKLRINSQTEKCLDAVNEQERSIQYFKNWGQVYYLRQAIDPNFKVTYDFLTNMSNLSDNKSAEINKKAFDSDFTTRGNCIDMIRGTYMLRIREIIGFTSDRYVADNDAISFCANIDKLKGCLSNFYSNAKFIENSSRESYQKNYQINPPKVPYVNAIEK